MDRIGKFMQAINTLNDVVAESLFWKVTVRKSALRRCLVGLCLGLLLFGAIRITAANDGSKELQLVVQPQGWEQSSTGVGPGLLAKYLSAITGIKIRASQSVDSLAHWHRVRTQGSETGVFELSLNEAQFTDYLIQHRHYTVLAQSSRTMRFTLVVRPGTVFTDPSDLSAQRIAVPAPPSLAALRLMELFPDSAQVPVMVQYRQVPQALQALGLDQVQAALVPLIDGSDYPKAQQTLITDASPGLGFSASPGVSHEQRRNLTRALLNAHRNEDGRRALKALNITEFELSSASVYEGSSGLLRGTWGYSSAN
jgi:hypothetical protein